MVQKEKISSERQLCGRKCLVDVRGERRMVRLVLDDRKTTATQITTDGEMDYSSRRPHRVPLLSAENRKRRLQFAQAHQNWTTEDWKTVAWSDESRFLLLHLDGRWWCNGVRDIFLAHFGPLNTNWALFKRYSLPEYCSWPCPSLYDYSAPIFWWLIPAG